MFCKYNKIYSKSYAWLVFNFDCKPAPTQIRAAGRNQKASPLDLYKTYRSSSRVLPVALITVMTILQKRINATWRGCLEISCLQTLVLSATLAGSFRCSGCKDGEYLYKSYSIHALWVLQLPCRRHTFHF